MTLKVSPLYFMNPDHTRFDFVLLTGGNRWELASIVALIYHLVQTIFFTFITPTMALTFSPSAHWRDSARNARFFVMDARAVFPLFIFFLHMRVWTGIMVLISSVFFGIIEHYGFTVPVFFRWIRCWIAGKVKIAQPWWQGYEF